MMSAKEVNIHKQMLDLLGVSVIVLNLDDGIIRYINSRVCGDLDRHYDEIVGLSFRQVFLPEFIPVFTNLLTQCEDGGEHSIIYYWAEKAIWEQIAVRLIEWETTSCALIAIMDVSEVARSEYRFENLTYFDNQLKLPNGQRLEEDINELANLETVALLFIEIEHFWDINNLYGWENGDRLLTQIRDWLLSSEFRRAQVYRVNTGFAIFGRKVTIDDAKERAGEILARFNRPWVLSAGGMDIEVYCTVKVGIVYGKYVRNEMRNILFRTISTAKNTNAGFVVYDEEADRKAKRALVVRDTLIRCILEGMKGFDVFYQPIVDAATERWVALEALCRWNMPDGTGVSPDEFIGVAEQLDLVAQIDEWVRGTAMRQCVELGLAKKDILLDVNFSPVQKIDNPFIARLFRSLAGTGFPARKLNLEITESAKMTLDEENLEGLKRLRRAGIMLSLDDFGTGYSSFANLIKISAQTLKVDKLFLDGIEKDAYRRYLLNMLVDLSHHLGMKLVAEGVETQEQLSLLRAYGVDLVQGYLFSKPLPVDRLAENLARFE